MKVIRVNRKIIGTVGVLLLAWLAFSLGNLIAPVIDTFRLNQQIEALERQGYKTYSALEGRFKYRLPEAWVVQGETFEGGEIVYNQYFKSPDEKIRGIVQVWSLKKPLKQFIEESKSAAVGAVGFKKYEMKQIMSDKRVGYLIDYIRTNSEGKLYHGYEAFIQGNDDKAYRVSFFVDSRDWKQVYLIIFNRIIQSFDITD